MRFLAILGAASLLLACSNEKKLSAACEKGDPGACDVLSARYAYGDGVAKDEALSKQMGARATLLCQSAGAESSASCARYSTFNAMPLDLPKASSSGEVQTVLSVVLAADGVVEIDGQRLPSDDAMLPLARSAHERNPEVRAVIRADSTVPHGRVIHALDLLKIAGVSKISFAVSPVAPVPPPPPEAPAASSSARPR